MQHEVLHVNSNMAEFSRKFCEKRCFVIFTEIVGRKLAFKHWKDIYLCLLAVDLGLKNSYLVDQCCMTSTQTETLIKQLRVEEFLSREDLVTVVVHGDVFVLQRENTLRYLERVLDEQCVCFIDVSQRLPGPSVLDCDQYFWPSIEEFCKEFSDFMEGIKLNKQEEDVFVTKAFDFQETILHPCTIFGLILGYPIVYWMSRESQINCLSESDLTVYSCSTTLQSWLPRKDDFVTVWSFSYPEKFTKHCEKYIKSWRDRLSSFSQEQTTLVLRITCKQVRLPVVIL